MTYLKVEDLTVEIAGERPIRPVDGIGFALEKGRTMALLGDCCPAPVESSADRSIWMGVV
jgi:Fe-S cluster assembly ATPase SufC